MGASAAAVRPGTPAPHLIDAHLLSDVDAAGPRPDLRAIRAVRPLLDRLDRRERASLVAVVTYARGPPAGALQAAPDMLARALALGDCLALSCGGLFDALHLAGALLRQLAGDRVLIVGVDVTAAAFLLSRQGGVVCLPLSPARATGVGGETASACGDALAECLARGGVHARAVAQVEAADLTRAEAASVARQVGLSHAVRPPRSALTGGVAAEVLLADAVLSPPAQATLLWRCRDGVVEGCVLAGG